MATRIRRAGLMVGLTLLMATCLAGVAWAANVVDCPGGSCYGTDRNDVMHGTEGKDYIAAKDGADILYGLGGRDFLTGGKGPDIVYGGLGNDGLGEASGCDLDSYCGEDTKYGGPGDDHIVGNLRSDHLFGGPGNDSFLDDYSHKNPDYFRCGPGRDVVDYNKGLDKVADDCEILKP